MTNSTHKSGAGRRERSTKVVDLMAYVVGVGGNIAVVPQIIDAWRGPAPGLSVLTWLMFVMIGLIWLVYAIIHQQRPLLIAQIANMSCNMLVVIGWVVHNH